MKVYLWYLILLLACGKSESPSTTVTKLNNVPVVNIFGPKIVIALGSNAYITSSDLSYSEKIDDSGSNGLTDGNNKSHKI